MNLLVVNGPNLNLLGTREPSIYGTATLADLEAQWQTLGDRLGISITAFQSNHEGTLIDAIHEARTTFDGIVLNAGALTHYSLALADAVVACELPFVEIHISNVHEREEWRHHSVLSEHADAVIVGRGTDGYLNAIAHLHASLTHPPVTRQYGTHGSAMLDLRTPSSQGPHPAVILIHGGYWRRIWLRDIMDPMAVDLLDHGFATVNIEYTTGPSSFPAALDDVNDAVSWVLDNATNFGIDADRVILVGHSAGGYLALQTGHSRDDLAGIVGLGSVVDLPSVKLDVADGDPAEAFLGGDAVAIPNVWDAAAIKGTPQIPTKLIHGTDDVDVNPIHAEMYVQRTMGQAALVVLGGVGHMELIDPADPSWPSVVAAVEGFVSR